MRKLRSRLAGTFKRFTRHLGVDVRPYAPSTSAASQLRTMLQWHEIDLVLDVGANVGQFRHTLRDHVGYAGRIVSFEPMKIAHERLVRVAAGDALWEVAERAALGATQGEVAIHVSRNSVSSSILPMLDAHARAAPESVYELTEQVPLRTLDSAAARYFTGDTVAFVKIDTQGYEDQVLDGASATLARAVGLQMELSMVALYEGQRLMREMLERIEAMGFELWGISPTFAEEQSGRMLQIDATFFRP